MNILFQLYDKVSYFPSLFQTSTRKVEVEAQRYIFLFFGVLKVLAKVPILRMGTVLGMVILGIGRLEPPKVIDLTFPSASKVNL